MEPRIQYAKTTDGAGIAYYSVGQGKPIVFAPGTASHIRVVAGTARTRAEDARLVSSSQMVVRYDGRGTGSSDRRRAEFSLEARVRDLEAIMDHLGLKDATLYGFTHGGPTCLAYAARYPERVSNLILVNAYGRGEDYYRLTPSALGPPQGDAPQARRDFYYRSMVRGLIAASSDVDAADEDRYVAMLRDSLSPAAFAAYRADSGEIDVTDLLPDIDVPALVIHVASVPFGAIELSEELAARIKGARLAVISEQSDAVAVIDEFLGISPEANSGGGTALPSGTAIILFTDIAGSTALTERMGDAAFRTAARTLDEGMRAAIREAGGSAIDGKLLGDGVMAVFPSAAQAIAAARRCVALSAEGELRLHVGLHAGDVIREAGNVYGGAVNIASRICALSAPGEILVSDIVRGLARTSAGVTFEDRGEQEMKGVGEPVRVYEVRWRE